MSLVQLKELEILLRSHYTDRICASYQMLLSIASNFVVTGLSVNAKWPKCTQTDAKPLHRRKSNWTWLIMFKVIIIRWKEAVHKGSTDKLSVNFFVFILFLLSARQAKSARPRLTTYIVKRRAVLCNEMLFKDLNASINVHRFWNKDF